MNSEKRHCPFLRADDLQKHLPPRELMRAEKHRIMSYYGFDGHAYRAMPIAEGCKMRKRCADRRPPARLEITRLTRTLQSGYRN
ncbi:hypothetical protein [Caballeronia sp. Lep1P3]|uniref:hypothetical protein n=1 Tax=Caballeronia sp. Lep1P3 TaxID=2878150 RepID=UPI001FD60B1F|nr:hypothetical protein [Caballeronia sp. Lep1P3]